MEIVNKVWIVLCSKPWHVIASGKDFAFEQLYTEIEDRKLLIEWDLLSGIKIFRAKISGLEMNSRQAVPLGIEVLGVDDTCGIFDAIYPVIRGLFKNSE